MDDFIHNLQVMLIGLLFLFHLCLAQIDRSTEIVSYETSLEDINLPPRSSTSRPSRDFETNPGMVRVNINMPFPKAQPTPQPVLTNLFNQDNEIPIQSTRSTSTPPSSSRRPGARRKITTSPAPRTTTTTSSSSSAPDPPPIPLPDPNSNFDLPPFPPENFPPFPQPAVVDQPLAQIQTVRTTTQRTTTITYFPKTMITPHPFMLEFPTLSPSPEMKRFWLGYMKSPFATMNREMNQRFATDWAKNYMPADSTPVRLDRISENKNNSFLHQYYRRFNEIYPKYPFKYNPMPYGVVQEKNWIPKVNPAPVREYANRVLNSPYDRAIETPMGKLWIYCRYNCPRG